MAASGTSFGTSYFGVRDPDHARRDLTAMRRAGYSWVLLPMTQDDAAWEVRTFRALVSLAEGLGLAAVVSPWGGDHFGGEGIAGPYDLPAWIDCLAATGARALHIDEPKDPPTSIPTILERWPGTLWLTLEPERADALGGLDTSRLEVLGTDAYTGTLTERVEATEGFARRTGRLDLAWVPAFRIPAGGEGDVTDSVAAMASLAPRVGVWGWKGSTGRGELRSDRPDQVESAVRAGMSAVRAGLDVLEDAVA